MNDHDGLVDCLNPKSQTPWPWSKSGTTSNMPGGSWLSLPTVLAEQGPAWRGKVSLGRVKQEPFTDIGSLCCLAGQPLASPAVEIMVCQQNEVPRLFYVQTERDRGVPRAWSPSPSSPGGCRQLPWCSCAPGLQDSPFSEGWVTLELGAGGKEELS